MISKGHKDSEGFEQVVADIFSYFMSSMRRLRLQLLRHLDTTEALINESLIEIIWDYNSMGD